MNLIFLTKYGIISILNLSGSQRPVYSNKIRLGKQ